MVEEQKSSLLSGITEERKGGDIRREGAKQFFVLVRHAQRADDPTMSWEMKKK